MSFSTSQFNTQQPVFNNAGYNWHIDPTKPYSPPTEEELAANSGVRPVELNPATYVSEAVVPINQNLGTNAGMQQIQPYYQTTQPQQSSYYWGNQTSGNGTTPQPTQTPPAQAWGTGNRNAVAQFDVDAFIKQMLSPAVQAADAGTTPGLFVPQQAMGANK